MSFKASGPKVRPDRVKPPPSPPPQTPSPTPAHPNAPSLSRRSSTSSTASFHSARFPLSEESAMVSSSNSLKTQANAQFSSQDYSSAISTYDRALAELPSYLDYEMAVLMSNIAACHLKLEAWKEAVDACGRGLDGLERELPTQPKKKKTKAKTTKNGTAKGKRKGQLNSDTESEPPSPTIAPEDQEQDDTVVELPSDTDEATALESLQISDSRKADIHRIRTKLLLRRARARSSLPPPNQWGSLSSALEDYKLLSTPAYFNTLPLSDQKTVRQALASLPPRINEAKEKEVGDMMGKLKELGNGILKPFGLSTENFKVVQGEGGGYSLSFDGGGGKKE